MEVGRKENIVSNSLYAVTMAFRHAPAAAGMYTFLALTSSGCSVAQILVLERLVDAVPEYLASAGSGILVWGLLYIAALAAASAYGFSMGKLDWHLRKSMTRSIGPAIAEKFSRIEYQYFENAEFQDMISRMSRNPQEKVHTAFQNIVGCVMQTLVLAGTLGIFFRASFWIGAGAALIGIPMSVLDVRTAGRQNRVLRDATWDQRMGEYQQGLFIDRNAVYEIKVFRAKDHILAMWHETSDKIWRRSIKVLKEVLRARILIGILKAVYIVFAAAALTLGFLAGKTGLGVLVAVLQSLGRLFSVLKEVSYSVSNLGSVTGEVGYVREFLGLAEEKKGDETGALAEEKKGEETGALAETAKEDWEIIFDHVFFRYPGTDREVLHDLSFRIRSGEKVALVGVNGAGKSTVVKLLCGLYQPDRGRIFVAGKDMKTLSRSDLRRCIAAVFQDFGSYQLTLRENIAFGDLARLNDDDSLLEALSLADSGEIAGFGLDARLGRLEEDSIDISKGQWQRIAVARAFLSDAAFVVLDEPAASLDPAAESRVYQSFRDVLEQRGAIIISHRLGSAKMADRILVLEGGEVAEDGSHEELIKNGGLYAVMYEEQSVWYQDAESPAEKKQEFNEKARSGEGKSSWGR